MCVFQTGRNGSDVFILFPTKTGKNSSDGFYLLCLQSRLLKRFQAGFNLLRIKALLILLLGFCTQLFLAVLWDDKNARKIEPWKKIWMVPEVFFFRFFFLNTMFFSSKKGFGVVSRMSKPRFKKNTFTGQLGLEMEWITKLKSSPGLASSVETSNVETHSTTLFSLEKRWVFARQQWNYCITQLHLQDSSHQPIFPKCTVEIMFHETYQTYG